MARWDSTEYYWWPKSGPLANRGLKASRNASISNLPKLVPSCLCEYYLSISLTRTDTLIVPCIRAFLDWRLSTKVKISAPGDVNDTLYEQEVF